MNVIEYGASYFSDIRSKHGLTEDFLLESFSLKSNEKAM